MGLVAGLLLALVQDLEKPAPKRIKPMPPAVVKQPAPFKPAEGTCDGSCHDRFQNEAPIDRVCEGCKKNVTVLTVDARICKECAEKLQVCPYCCRLRPGSKGPAAKRIQDELDKLLPGHKVGRALPGELAKKLLPRVSFFLVIHDGSPCKTCAKNAEPIAVMECKDEKDQVGEVRILTSEKELSDLLIRQKLVLLEGPDTAGCVAELVQALWEPVHGGLEKKSDGTYEYKKGHAWWKLTVTFGEGGAFTGLEVQDTGRACK